MDDFSKYERLRDCGAKPDEVYLLAKADGLDTISLLRLLRQLFQLSITEAKEVTIVADKLASSLEEYQEKLIPDLKKALEGESTEFE